MQASEGIGSITSRRFFAKCEVSADTFHFAKYLAEGHIYIRSFLTHKQYDNPANWDKGVTR